MQEPIFELVDVRDLRVGMYVELDLGWLSHPFPTGHFKITSVRQLDVLRSLGVQKIRCIPSKSDPAPQDGAAFSGKPSSEQRDREVEARRKRAELIEAQHRNLKACERKFAGAQQCYRTVQDEVLDRPLPVRDVCQELIAGFVSDMSCDGESAIRLLSEGVGERAAMHPVNVTVLSMLLGKSVGLTTVELNDLGMAAFLHDVGKLQLPKRVRWFEEGFSIADFQHYQEHVARGVAIASQMELSEGAIMAIAQHHELMDGSGFPARPAVAEVSRLSRILALVNRYDNMCNPVRLTAALTPHEALSQLFTQQKSRFDNMVLSSFIRMMGVYPPGSVVQLLDGRYALVVSVNSVRPLKPCVIVYEPSVPRYEALIVDLEVEPGIGIRRSLKPASLPADAFDYLGPRQRIAYFFENSAPAPLVEA